MAEFDIPSNGDTTFRVAAKELREFCVRIEDLKANRKEINEEIKDVRRFAKGKGYDLKALDEMLKLRALEPAERSEREALRQLYGEALEIFN